MSRAAVIGLVCATTLVACSGHQRRAAGPPPEYERPNVMPWDAGEPVDPLDNVKGEAVDDDEPTPAPTQTDAGTPDAHRELGPEAGPSAFLVAPTRTVI